MQRNHFRFGLLILLGAAASIAGGGARERDPVALESFYIVLHGFTDGSPFWFDYILDVRPQQAGVLVRDVRIVPADRYCGGVLVQAAERVLPHTNVRKIAGRNFCSYSPENVAAAIAAAAPKKGRQSIFDTASQTIVAKCGMDEKVFEFPYPEEMDLKALRRASPEVYFLYDTNSRIYERVFGKNFWFHELTPGQEKEFDDLGTKVVPELISGRYDAGFGGSSSGDQKCDSGFLACLLKGYSGTPEQSEPFHVELVDESSLPLAKYISPAFPVIAKIARVLGDVRLKITVNPQTGVVRNVEALSGPELLAKPAVAAARAWEFFPGTQSGQPIEATLRFDFHCPGD
jgi:TonB family protein